MLEIKWSLHPRLSGAFGAIPLKCWEDEVNEAVICPSCPRHVPWGSSPVILTTKSPNDFTKAILEAIFRKKVPISMSTQKSPKRATALRKWPPRNGHYLISQELLDIQ
ncbi:hypothetical protein ABEB36_012455 [Hypothenemus hampei]|uniref:Uncharacterized protein n=1 Tax=Hypothenemus hampei TaxID=57062 RepID=A0ABD1EBM4_HYPHA